VEIGIFTVEGQCSRLCNMVSALGWLWRLRVQCFPSGDFPALTSKSDIRMGHPPRCAAVQDIVSRSRTFRFLGHRMEEYSLSDCQSTDASDRAVDSRSVLVHTNYRFQHFWRRSR
jgi:hypothetical protein